MRGLRVIAISLFFILVCTSSLGLLSYEMQGSIESIVEQNETYQVSYTSHSPIVINSNAGFESQGWPGNGSAISPYIIEGYNITDNSVCIDISTTDAYFEIRNCIISAPTWSGQAGIQFDQVGHGTIRDCLIQRHYWTVLYFDSYSCNLVNNTITYYTFGCDLEDSSDLILENNTVYDGYCGIYMQSSSYCTITNNTVYDNSKDGFWLYDCPNSVITKNTVSDNDENGIHFQYGTSYCNVTDNTATDSGYDGFYLDGSYGCNLTNNIALRNGDYGFHLDISRAITLKRNTAASNDYGIFVEYYSNISLFYLNYLYDNSIANARDQVGGNDWDNGIFGNYWDDYSGTGTYPIIGGGGSVDNHPFVLDLTQPSINHPNDIEYECGTTGHTITWNPSDAFPVSYEVYRDDVFQKSDSWNGSSIIVNVDDLPVGVYYYTLFVFDIGLNSISDTVMITVVDTTSPTIDHPADIDYNEFTTGHSITWSPDDLNPESYIIYLDGVIEDSDDWSSSSETISISVDGHSEGSYNYTIIVFDESGNTASDTVMVIVMASTTTVTSTETSTVTTTTTSITGTGESNPMILTTVVIGALAVVVILVIVFIKKR